MKLLHLAILGLALLPSGCWPASEESSLTYTESTEQAVKFVDEPLRRTFGEMPLPKSFGVRPQTSCVNSQMVYPNYSYEFPIQVLGDNPERLVEITEQFWRDEGFKIVKEDNPGVTRRFGSLERGFTSKVMVNHVSGIALISASGPCADPPDGR